jgi:hypothetical protein
MIQAQLASCLSTREKGGMKSHYHDDGTEIIEAWEYTPQYHELGDHGVIETISTQHQATIWPYKYNPKQHLKDIDNPTQK